MTAATVDSRSAAVPRPLTTHEKEIVASLYLHRLLTTSQIHKLHDSTKHIRATQLRLNRLEERGFVAHAIGEMPGKQYRWFLTALGAEMAELGGDVEIRKFRMDLHRATSAHADHLMAANAFGVALTQAARQHGDRFDHRHWTHEVAHRYGRGPKDQLSADSLIIYDVHGDAGVTSERRFIEIDRGTEPVHALVDKVYAYKLLSRWEPPRKESETHLAKRAWSRSYPTFPGVVFVFVGLNRQRAEARATDLAHWCAVDTRLGTTQIDVAVTTLEAVQAHGPFARICRLVPSEESVPMFRRP